MVSEELQVSEIVTAPEEGNEYNEIASEPVNEADELRAISSKTDMREKKREAEPNAEGQSERVSTVKSNYDIRYQLDGH